VNLTAAEQRSLAASAEDPIEAMQRRFREAQVARKARVAAHNGPGVPQFKAQYVSDEGTIYCVAASGIVDLDDEKLRSKAMIRMAPERAYSRRTIPTRLAPTLLRA